MLFVIVDRKTNEKLDQAASMTEARNVIAEVYNADTVCVKLRADWKRGR